MSKKSESKYLAFIILGFLLSSATIFLVPFASFKEEGLPLILSYVIGGGFWLGLLIAITFTMILNTKRKNGKKNGEKRLKRRAVGAFKFFSNKVATFFDAGFILSLIAQLVISAAGINNQILSIVTLFVLAFAFEMHCVFNGRNYIYIKNIKEL